MSAATDRVLAVAKAAFFDREAVFRRVDAARTRGLSKFGAYVRTRAQRSMRKRKKAGEPGSPPSSHGGSKEGLRFILFGYDPATRSVVVGPVPFFSKKSPTGVPRLHEFGGTVRADGRKVVAARPTRDGSTGRFTSGGTVALHGLLRYPARPYMRPALEAEKGKFPLVVAAAGGVGFRDAAGLGR